MHAGLWKQWNVVFSVQFWFVSLFFSCSAILSSPTDGDLRTSTTVPQLYGSRVIRLLQMVNTKVKQRDGSSLAEKQLNSLMVSPRAMPTGLHLSGMREAISFMSSESSGSLSSPAAYLEARSVDHAGRRESEERSVVII